MNARRLTQLGAELAEGFAIGVGVGALVELVRYGAERVSHALVVESTYLAALQELEAFEWEQELAAGRQVEYVDAYNALYERAQALEVDAFEWRNTAVHWHQQAHGWHKIAAEQSDGDGSPELARAHQLERESSAAAARESRRADELYTRLQESNAVAEQRGELVRELTAELVRLRESARELTAGATRSRAELVRLHALKTAAEPAEIPPDPISPDH